ALPALILVRFNGDVEGISDHTALLRRAITADRSQQSAVSAQDLGTLGLQIDPHRFDRLCGRSYVVGVIHASEAAPRLPASRWGYVPSRSRKHSLDRWSHNHAPRDSLDRSSYRRSAKVQVLISLPWLQLLLSLSKAVLRSIVKVCSPDIAGNPRPSRTSRSRRSHSRSLPGMPV